MRPLVDIHDQYRRRPWLESAQNRIQCSIYLDSEQRKGVVTRCQLSPEAHPQSSHHAVWIQLQCGVRILKCGPYRASHGTFDSALPQSKGENSLKQWERCSPG